MLVPIASCQAVNRPIWREAETMTCGIMTVMHSPRWENIVPANEPPTKRTGHIMVNHQDKLYM